MPGIPSFEEKGLGQIIIHDITKETNGNYECAYITRWIETPGSRIVVTKTFTSQLTVNINSDTRLSTNYLIIILTLVIIQILK